MMTDEEKTTVTIRGIDKRIYDRLSVLARELDKTIGELVNEAIRLVVSLQGRIESLGEKILLIEQLDRLEINRKDLEELDKKVLLQNIKELVISSDVSTDVFKDRIYRISNVDNLVIEADINKLLVYSKCTNVKNISFKKA